MHYVYAFYIYYISCIYVCACAPVHMPELRGLLTNNPQINHNDLKQ